ncbi:MAG TPA: class I SAM-dependent methyltransferase [Nitrospira sp.]|jgi:SAM-dependent methyltransferase|nr:class I SAM-dependent methyltransferase [Nitrospira sp.]
MATTGLSPDVDRLKARLRSIWMAGDYDRFSRYLEDGAREFYERIPKIPGGTWLDVACGSGQLALLAARDGHDVTGVDIAGNLIEQARARASTAELKARFEVADAEALPFAGAQFDVVTSLIGAMFAPRPELVAAELLRVCQPGGIIAMANWTPQGFVGQMFKAVSNFIAPSGMPSPVLWGEETTVRERLGSGLSDLRLTRRAYPFRYPFPPAEVVQHFRLYYGPIHQAFAALGGRESEELRYALEALWTRHNRAGQGGTMVSAEYLEVIGVRAVS